ncbi:hypothetical protein I546_6055 [Mycobacterium kansasii 732]|uniref:Uncharacterized protein n=1 Tax=Mycobacterium kansasii TaxID=1768 RepID=A0A1V3XR36_MYCKA|nr:hypothetical protein I546_6055 [Mycobacterium kansasii 732]OOK81665.1 hypothetical protein BZL30_0688 [Mycobacterium kansasii]
MVGQRLTDRPADRPGIVRPTSRGLAVRSDRCAARQVDRMHQPAVA